jgi:glycosyltransferase involved in cell wall biosynthesis
MPFFSIIIPTYNRAHLIAETIASVQTQTFENWECIVVDDGSTDHTKELISQISQKDERIRYVYQKNAERSAARNNGIHHAKGEYVCFLDSDDFYEPEHLQILFEQIITENKPVALFFTNYKELNNNHIYTPAVPSLTDFANKLDYFMTYAIIPARVCIHATILENIQFDEDITNGEDAILWARITDKFPVFHVVNPTVMYVIHEDNSINIKGKGVVKRLYSLNVFYSRYPQLSKKLSSGIKNELYSNTYFNIVKHYIYHKRTVKAIKALILSCIYMPVHSQNKHKLFILKQLLLNKPIVEYEAKH